VIRQICFFYLLLLLGTTLTSIQAQNAPSGGGTDTVPKLHYKIEDNRYPFQTTENPGGINLKTPSNLTKTIEYDPITKEYVFKEKIGTTDYRRPYSMTSSEYKDFELKNSKSNYWVEKRKGDKGEVRTGLLPKLNIGGETFDKIFGSNTINIVPQGSAELIFGLNTSRISNPNISEKLRKTTNFDFQEKIQMNVTGSIGDKMKLGVNYNTEASFEFENKTKLEYTGKEDEIIKKIEAGNVTLPLTGTLITGSQSLFGIKTELQFGKLTVTSVFSQQRGESSVIEVKGGAQVSEYEVPVDQYEANKHFFLAQYFRNRYEAALSTFPNINSGVTITKIEVWVTNKNSAFQDARNIVAFMDLGEGKRWNHVNGFEVIALGNDSLPRNEISGLYNNLINNYNARNIQQVSNSLAQLNAQNFFVGQDYDKIESARMLTDREYTYHPTLGYISLNSTLGPDEILAVAFEYTYKGQTYRVGDLSTSNTNPGEALVLKLIKPTNLTPQLPTWNLMMKNIYSINAYQVNREDFTLDVLYRDDKNGTAINYIPEDSTSKDILLRVLKLDRVNTNLDPTPDGVFDFVEDVTINASNGRIIFPTLEPFGSTLQRHFARKGVSNSIAQKYVFRELYDSTQTKARQIAEKNKFLLKGTYKSSGGSDIPLNALNVPQGSVVVTAGGRKLTENIDYTVDYTLGRVKIINQGLLESGTPINISLESNTLFNFQTKTLIGTHLDYKFSDNFNLGATILHLTERPLTQKVNIGDEPISNTIWGLNGTYTTKSQFLTTLVDKIPLLNVKEPSSFTIDGEFAQLIPGHSKAIKKAGNAYIDDFEGSETSIDMRSFQSWTLASTPQDRTLFPESSRNNDLSYNFNRAKIAWYVIDPLFLRDNSATPTHIKQDKDAQSSNFVREVYEEDIFHNKETTTGLPSNIPVLNVAYYPTERGPYNYDTTNVATDGSLTLPESRWGGIQREVLTNDFEAANVEFIEFWLMNPFAEDTTSGGKLYIDLGDVSEDLLKDSRKSFENGLPTTEADTAVSITAWGKVSEKRSFEDAFDNDPNTRKYQDVGLDGLSDVNEQSFFEKYLNSLRKIVNNDAYNKALSDPSSDDFHYYRGDDYDNAKKGILERYKQYNGLDGNSPVITSTTGDAFSGSSLPNSEDINRDNTLNEGESFFQYKIDITPDKLKVGTNFIVDQVTNKGSFANGDPFSVEWFQFRIPISEYEKAVGSIQDFKSIKFMRMFLHNFHDSIILRFARLDLVRGEWRKYTQSFRPAEEGSSTPEENGATFDISSVNIEENGDKKPINYVLPPGITRQIDPSNPQLRQLNEQSMVLKVNNLVSGDARAAYKNINFDIRQYKKLQMEIHAEAIPGASTFVKDDELTVFIRLGSDYKNNFYEYEIPLKITSVRAENYDNESEDDRLAVWPEDNRIDIDLSDLQQAKQARNDEIRKGISNTSMTSVWPFLIPGKRGKYYVCGNPNLSNIRTIMIGIRNPSSPDGTQQVRSLEVWVNELRVSDFNEKGGWAANLRTTTKLSDFGTVSVAGNTSTPGFGSIEKKINDRSKESVYQYDIASNFELGKFFPEKARIQVPMYFGFSETFIDPQYNPLDPDIELSAALKNLKTKAEKDSVRRIVRDYTRRKSINFTNVKINKGEGKPHFYDISNLSFDYAYNETFQRNINTQHNIQKHFSGGLMYSYQFRPKNVAPFQKVKFLRGNAFKLVRDFNFNYIPTNISFRTDMSRTYNETLLRNLNNPNFVIEPTVNKDFLWNRFYDVGFDLTKSLKLNYSASNVARIDESNRNFGIVDKELRTDYDHWKDTVWQNIKKGGRTTHYDHTINLDYTIPINKFPLLDWTSARAGYDVTYDWNTGQLKDPYNLGNTINNSNTLRLSGDLNLTTLYNKVPYFRKVNQPQNKQNKQQKKYKTVNYEREKTFLNAKEPKSISHNLSTESVTVTAFDSRNRPIKGNTNVVNKDKITFTADSSFTDVRIVVEGKVEQKPSAWTILSESFTRMVLGVKNISISWSRTEGTLLPGYLPKTNFFGMSMTDPYNAPGLPFVLGYQDKNFAEKAANKYHWLTTSQYINSPVQMTSNESLNIRSLVEPIPSFKIEITATRTLTHNKSAYYIADSTHGYEFTEELRNRQETGNFSMSFVAIGSAFHKLKSSDNYNSPVFNQFLKNRQTIAQRLGQDRAEYVEKQKITHPDPYEYHPNLDQNGDPITDGTNGFGLTSQNVVIPAFMAAYGDINANKVSIGRIPPIFAMMPNWRITYDGLTKIGFIEKYARSVSVNHAYRCTYNIGSFISNSDYDLEEFLTEQRDIQNNFIPRLDIASVSITEQFGPLASLDVNFKNSLSTKFEMRRNRTISLSMANSQLMETSSNELIIGAGYKFTDVQFSIKSGNTQKAFKSDLNLRADVSIRDNKTIIRPLDATPQPSQGQKIVTIKVSADYKLSDKFNIRMFYDRIVNTPLVSLSYPTANTNIGISLQFSLTQ
jgi:cell surface protein SprA